MRAKYAARLPTGRRSLPKRASSEVADPSQRWLELGEARCDYAIQAVVTPDVNHTIDVESLEAEVGELECRFFVFFNLSQERELHVVTLQPLSRCATSPAAIA
jgi:hypothetical protein